MHPSRQADPPSAAVRGEGDGPAVHRAAPLRPGQVVQRQQLLLPPHLHPVARVRPHVGARQVRHGEESRHLRNHISWTRTGQMFIRNVF